MLLLLLLLRLALSRLAESADVAAPVKEREKKIRKSERDNVCLENGENSFLVLGKGFFLVLGVFLTEPWGFICLLIAPSFVFGYLRREMFNAIHAVNSTTARSRVFHPISPFFPRVEGAGVTVSMSVSLLSMFHYYQVCLLSFRLKKSH